MTYVGRMTATMGTPLSHRECDEKYQAAGEKEGSNALAIICEAISMAWPTWPSNNPTMRLYMLEEIVS